MYRVLKHLKNNKEVENRIEIVIRSFNVIKIFEKLSILKI